MTAEAKKIKGFTRINNEVLEALCRARLGGREIRVVLAVIRLTTGYNCQEAKISLGRLSKLTAIPKEDLCKITKQLARKGFLRRRKKAGRLVLGLAKEGLVNQPICKNANPQNANFRVGKSTNFDSCETLGGQGIRRSLKKNIKENNKKTLSPSLEIEELNRPGFSEGSIM